jgi:hypothetical protein
MPPREQDRRAQQREHNPIVVYTVQQWCDLRGFSIATGRRIIAAGKVKVTRLSERRIGIRSDHDRAYLDARMEER